MKYDPKNIVTLEPNEVLRLKGAALDREVQAHLAEIIAITKEPLLRPLAEVRVDLMEARNEIKWLRREVDRLYAEVGEAGERDYGPQ